MLHAGRAQSLQCQLSSDAVLGPSILESHWSGQLNIQCPVDMLRSGLRLLRGPLPRKDIKLMLECRPIGDLA